MRKVYQSCSVLLFAQMARLSASDECNNTYPRLWVSILLDRIYSRNKGT